ncbi:MAG: phospholipid carrier-dependent glycosyltransferase [Sphingobacteriia bacterium]|nr:MAG: phospholipid carrier-dependent glycosyltransferase [Sphingobacteriia bacterium]
MTLLKCLAAPWLELGNDEVYYWTYAVRPAANYFDHPPGIAALILLTTLKGWWVNTFSLRLGAILCCAVSTFLVFRLGKLLFSEQTGWYAALLYNASVYAGWIAGFFILPDSIQLPFYLAALLAMAHLVRYPQLEQKAWIWLSLGALIGLAALCKIHGLFLWGGFGLFLLLNRPKVFLQKGIYLGGLTTLVFLLPILWWNVQFDFITYRFHADRIDHDGLQWTAFLQEVLGEFAYQNPLVYIAVIMGLVQAIRQYKTHDQKEVFSFLFCLGLPLIALFWGIALRNPTLPHWSGPGFLPLYIVAAQAWAQKSQGFRRFIFPLYFRWALGFVVVVLALGIALVQNAPRNFGSQEKNNYGEYCPSLDLSGWADLGQQFGQLVAADQSSGTMGKNAVLLTHKWFPGGHLAFYVARPVGMDLVGIGALTDLHQFAWLNLDLPPLVLGQDAYAIVPSNLPMDPTSIFGPYFKTLEKPLVWTQERGGKTVRYFYVYRLKNCVQVPPSALLAQP